VELQSKNKTNSFVDRRFAENNPDLSYEDKMLLRFQKMRQVLLIESKSKNQNFSSYASEKSRFLVLVEAGFARG
jgi:hypothetical protein